MKLLLILLFFINCTYNCSVESTTHKIFKNAIEDQKNIQKCNETKMLLLLALKGQEIEVDGLKIYPHQYDCEKSVQGRKQGRTMGE